MITAILLLVAAQSFEPLSSPIRPPAQDERERNQPVPTERPASSSTAWLDLSHATVGIQTTRLAFSSDFVAERHTGGGLLAHAPSPWLSHKVFDLAQDDLGAFVDFSFGGVQRDLAALKNDGAAVFFISLGIDYTVFKNETWLAQIQIGGQYGNFGDTSDLNSGMAALFGLNAGLRIVGPVWLTLDPQVSFGNSGDAVYFLKFGLQFDL